MRFCFYLGIMLAEVPMIDPKSQVSSLRQCSELVNWDGEDTWQWWNKFRTYADYSPKIKVSEINITSDWCVQ